MTSDLYGLPEHDRHGGTPTLPTPRAPQIAGVATEARPVDTTVVIPTRNESANVAPLVDRLGRAFAGRDMEILFVDDSTDDTPAAIATAARAADVRVRVIHRSGDDRAGGLASAVATGIAASTAPFVVVMDGDLQHPPEVAPALRDTAEAADLAVASRYLDAGTADGLASGYRRWVSSGTTWLAQAMFPRRVGGVCTDPMTGFFCVRREAVDLSRLRPRGFKVLLEILARHDLRVREVPFQFADRIAGETKAGFGIGLQFLLQLAGLRFGRMSRFAVVGALGALVNLAVMAGVLLLPHVHYVVASLAGAAVSILFNFVLQERFVFADLRADGQHSRAGRLGRHVGINGAEAVLRLPLLILLTTGLGITSVVAQALLLGVAFVARFVATGTVVYRTRHEAAAPDADARPQATGAHTLPTPPTDEERVSYLAGPQHRWFFWAHAASFAGIAYSLYGFARMQYWTLIFLIPLALRGRDAARTADQHLQAADHAARPPVQGGDLGAGGLPVGGRLPAHRGRGHGPAGEHVPACARGRVPRHVAGARARRHGPPGGGGAGYPVRVRLPRPAGQRVQEGRQPALRVRPHGRRPHPDPGRGFRPSPGHLARPLPYMDMNDPTLGIVQSPQVFPTPKHMGWIERCAGATQEMFYRFIQPSRDSVDGAICVGTSALYRRAALDAIGGFPKINHSEDVFTGFEMTKHGYHLLYVPINATQGICPDAIDPFITQQYRWCEGSMELVKGREFHTHPQITVRQRLSFWAGFFYYFTTAMNAFFAPLPVLILVWLFPRFIHPWNMLPLAGLLILWLVVYPLLMRSRWRLDVLRVQAIYGFTHAFAIYDVFAGKTAAWVPSHGTNKSTPLAVKVKRTMAWYLTVTFGLVIVGIGFRLSPLGGGYSLAEWWALIAFILINLYVFVPVAAESFRTLGQDRSAARRAAARERFFTFIENRAETAAAPVPAAEVPR